MKEKECRKTMQVNVKDTLKPDEEEEDDEVTLLRKGLRQAEMYHERS